MTQVVEERDLKLTELENQGKQHVQDKEDLEKARSELTITKEQNDHYVQSWTLWL